MNPIALITSSMTLATQFAPLLPEIVGDVKGFVAAGEQVVSDVKKLDASATLADLEAIFQQAQVDMPTVTKVIAASKAIAASV